MIEKELCNLEGSVDSVVYRNEVNGFVVFTLDSGNEPVTVVGEIGNVEEGEELRLTGEYIDHPKFGPQFKAQLCERALPKTAAAIQKYLASGVIKGIGPVSAKRIVKMFGDTTLDIIEHDPDKLLEVEGITKKKVDTISSEFINAFGIRTLMSYLVKFTVSPSYGVKAWKILGKDALEIIKNNPFVLCRYEIELPFVKAQEIADSLDISHEDENRISAGISCVLLENTYSGHTCLPVDKLEDITCRMLEINSEDFYTVLQLNIDNGIIIEYIKKARKFIYLRPFYEAESYIAKRMEVMLKFSFDTGINYDEVIKIDESQNDIKYGQLQKEAINTALSKGLMILTGGPGTGKTTTLNAIISLFEQQGEKVFICAPTGKAAKRISEITGYDAKTIHRMLDIQPSDGTKFAFVHDESNPLECDVVIIDEMSMVDVLLFEALLHALPLNCKLVMVGDSDQLPSVGAGNLLKDLIESNTVSVVKLTEIFRQAEKSCIVTNAHKIVNGEMPELKKKDNDFFFFQRLSFDEVSDTVLELCNKRLPQAYKYSPIDDIQVLCPTRLGPIGTVEFNKKLQAVINPYNKLLPEIKTHTYTYRMNDKVMQTKNNYDIKWVREEEKGSGIFNGDIGTIMEVDRLSMSLKINFDGRICIYNNAMIEHLELAYAITVHKSQGSEFNVVIIPLLGGYDKLYFRNLLYTAVTRAKKMLIIVGSSKRVEYMVNNNRRTNRYSCLKNMLEEECNESPIQEML